MKFSSLASLKALLRPAAQTMPAATATSEDLPEQDLCPFTCDLIVNPIFCSDGRTYGDQACRQLLLSPSTYEPMRALKRNVAEQLRLVGRSDEALKAFKANQSALRAELDGRGDVNLVRGGICRLEEDYRAKMNDPVLCMLHAEQLTQLPERSPAVNDSILLDAQVVLAFLPTYAPALLLKVDCLRGLLREDDLLSLLPQLKAEPGHPQRLVEMAEIYEKRGKIAAAIQCFADAMALAPEDNDLRWKNALLFCRIPEHPDRLDAMKNVHLGGLTGDQLAPLLDRASRLKSPDSSDRALFFSVVEHAVEARVKEGSRDKLTQDYELGMRTLLKTAVHADTLEALTSCHHKMSYLRAHIEVEHGLTPHPQKARFWRILSDAVQGTAMTESELSKQNLLEKDAILLRRALNNLDRLRADL